MNAWSGTAAKSRAASRWTRASSDGTPRTCVVLLSVSYSVSCWWRARRPPGLSVPRTVVVGATRAQAPLERADQASLALQDLRRKEQARAQCPMPAKLAYQTQAAAPAATPARVAALRVR